MVELGEADGVRTAALLTDMHTPLAHSAGNALEVTESVEVLAGGGPPDVVELTITLAEVMCELAGIDADPAARAGVGGGDGQLALDGRGPGRRPGRPAPRGTACRDGHGGEVGCT